MTIGDVLKHKAERAALRETLKNPPSIEQLMGWEAEGGCEAACPEGCWVEPDGYCEHGQPSWLLVLGLI